MNLLIGLLPALFWGMLPLCVARIGGPPRSRLWAPRWARWR